MNYTISERGSRTINEDAYCTFIQENFCLYLVADGCGGHLSGEVASNYVVANLPQILCGYEPSKDSIIQALNVCNIGIIEEQKKYPGMRTTVVGMFLSEEKTYAFNVGDSRLYQIRDGKVIFSTEDHSIPYLLYKADIIEYQEINNHEDRNKLLSSLGNQEKIKINVYELDIEKGDLFLLSSDGFWENLTSQDFVNCRLRTAETWLMEQRDKILQKEESDQDNFTAMIVGGINE